MGTDETFIDLCLSGRESPDAIDDRVDEWHGGAGESLSLAEFLGMTDAEYALWAETGSLSVILINRRLETL